MNTTTYRRGRQVAVPEDLLAEAGITDGDELVFEKRNGEVAVRRAATSDDVDFEFASGEVHGSGTVEEFLAELDTPDAAPPAG